MPPMKAAAAKKAPGKPSAPKKPTSRSKTGNSACSQAASNWQLAIRGKAPLDPDTYKTLGKCRAMSRASKSADDRADMGYNLSEQGRTALKGRLQKRFDQGLITQKSRQDRLKTLLAQRKEKQATAATAKTEKQPWEMTREDYAASIGAAKPVPTFFGDVSGHQAAFMSGSAIRSRAKQVAARKAVEREAYNAASKKWENSVRDAVSEKKIIPSKIVESDDFDSDVYNLAAEEFMKKGVDLPSPFKLRKMGESRFSFLVDKENQFYRTFSAPAPAAKPIDKAASLVAAVRQKPGYENTRLNKADDYKRGVREKLISTFVQDAIAGGRVPSKILDDMRDVRNLWISEAGGNAIRLPDHNTRPTFYMRPPSFLKGSVKRSIEKKASNVRKFWGVDDNDGGINTTPLLHKAQASAAARKAGKKHKAYKQLNATPAPAPAPAKFSRSGQLAPGRGTAERSDLARRLRHFKRVTDTYVSVSKNSHVGELREVATGIRQRAPFNPTVARKVGLSLGGNLTEYEKTRRKARLSTKKANKLASPSKR